MARNEQDTYSSYARDEFDNPPAGPVGAHRGKTALWSRLLPYLVVVLVAALAGMIAWGVYSGAISSVRFPWSKDTTSVATAPASRDKTSSSSKSAAGADASNSASSNSAASSPSESASPSSSPSSSAPQQTVNKATAIVVANATRITGHAAQQANLLAQRGYTSVSSRNATGQIPPTTVVMYQNETDKATAQDVANALGISSVEQVSGISGPIVVVLVQ